MEVGKSGKGIKGQATVQQIHTYRLHHSSHLIYPYEIRGIYIYKIYITSILNIYTYTA